MSLDPRDIYLRNFIYTVALYRSNNKLVENLSLDELSKIFNAVYGEPIELSPKNNVRVLKMDSSFESISKV